MTDAQKAHGTEGLAQPPGLQLMGDDTAMGMCVDGVCVMPSAQPSDSVASKGD